MLVPKLRFKREDGTDYPEWEEKTLQDVSFYITATGIGEKSVYVGTENMRKDCLGVVLEDNNDTTVKGIQYAVNDVLVSNIRPYLKKAWKADRGGICSPDVLCIRGTSGVLSEYLYTLLSSDSFFEYVMQGVKGTKMPRGDKKHIMDMPVSIPCLEEQQKIADFLSTVDEVIAQSEAEVQNLEQQKKAAMQKIFSQEVRFKREDGTEYPDWEDCILSDYCEEIKSSIDPQKYPNDTFLEYSMPAFDMDKTPSTVIGSDMNSNRKIVSNPCVLINKLNVRKKRIWKVPNPTDNSVCSAEFIPVTSDKMSIDFLEHLALSDRFTARLLDCSTGTSNSQKRVTPDIIMDMPITIPCFEEQQKIADFLSAYDEAISYAKQELDKWKELKKGLLQQMFV